MVLKIVERSKKALAKRVRIEPVLFELSKSPLRTNMTKSPGDEALNFPHYAGLV